MLTRIAVLVSGGGTNLQALIDASKTTLQHGEIKLVIASNKDAYALKRASDANIDHYVLSPKELGADFDDEMIALIAKYQIDLIVLAGYLAILSPKFVNHYKDRIVNIHPSLIPSFCGKGMYGLKVHEAALKKGVKVTGATVHLVNEIPDDGLILAQKAVLVKENDDPSSLQKRVMEEAEWVILPQAVEALSIKIMEAEQCQK